MKKKKSEFELGRYPLLDEEIVGKLFEIIESKYSMNVPKEYVIFLCLLTCAKIIKQEQGKEVLAGLLEDIRLNNI